MKKRTGFTLVELLAVIILIGLLMAIAVPSALKLSSKVKQKAYRTKVDLIEEAAKSYGQSNINVVRKGIDPTTNFNNTCTFTYNGEDIETITYARKSSGYSESLTLNKNEYWCTRLTLQDLVNSNDLDYDEKGVCDERCGDEKEDYDNIIINPKSNYIMNKCYVFIYYKYNRVYAVFDEKTCLNQSNTPALGHEYVRKS